MHLRRFIGASQKQSLNIPPYSPLEKTILKDCTGRNLISVFYYLLISWSPESSKAKLRVWREYLWEGISFDEREDACKEAQTQTENAHLELLQYNWLMRTYTTPGKLNNCNVVI